MKAMTVTIGNNKLKRVVNTEVRHELIRAQERYLTDIDAILLWSLHTTFGMGVKRLRMAFNAFSREYDKLTEEYDAPNDGAGICVEKLRRMGIDVKAWEQEEDERRRKENENKK